MAFTKLEPKSVNTSATFTFADANITGNLAVNGETNLGSAANITITGGSAGQVLSTDGTGNLSWADGGAGGEQVVVSGFTGITQDTFTGDGTEIDFTLSTTPDSRDFVYVNIDGITQQRSAFDISGDVLTFSEPPFSGEIIEVTTYLARGLTTAGSNTQVQYNNNGDLGASPNFTFNSSTGVLQASFLKGDGYQIGNIRAANIYGEVPSSHMAGTVFMNAQPNITSVGTLIDLTVAGNVTATKFIGDGSQLTGISVGSSAPAGTNTQVQFNDNGTTAGNSAFTFNKTTGTLSATKFAGDGSLLTGVVTDLTGYATQTYVNTQISNLVDAAPTTLNTLNELAAALGDDANFSTTVTNTLANKLNANAFTYANITGKPTLSTVATSGSYTDLTNKPTLFDGTYANLTGKPSLFSGSYADLTNKPSIPADISDLTDTTNLLGVSALTELTGVVINSGTLTTGQVLKYDGTNWVNGTDATSGTSGGGGVTSYIDLTDKPFIPYDVSELTDTTNLLISSYNELSDKPSIPTSVFDLGITDGTTGQVLTTDGAGVLTFSTVATGIQLTDLSVSVQPSGVANLAYDNTTGVFAFTPPDLSSYSTFSGSYSDLTNKPSIPADISDLTDTTNLLSSGVTSYNNLTDKPTIPADISDLTDTTSLLGGGGVTSYNDLTDKPTLGTAAATNSTAYATAAQGAKADTALQASALTSYATQSYVGTQISNLVDAAPTTLNTLNELAAALGDDPNFATSMTSLIGAKLATADFASTATTWLGTKSTTNLSEGANLYYTVARANTAIDNRVTKTYIDNLNIVASTVTSSSQPSVTSLGTLTALTVNGITTLGANSNVKISGGLTGQVLSTDGTGNLSWVAQSSGGGGGSGATTLLDLGIEDGTTGQLLSANGDGTFSFITVMPEVYQSKTYYWSGPLTYSLGEDRVYVPISGSLSKVSCYLQNAGSSATTISVVKNNSTVVTTVTIAAGELLVKTTPNSTLLEDDYLTVDITSAGTSASDLHVVLLFSKI